MPDDGSARRHPLERHATVSRRSVLAALGLGAGLVGAGGVSGLLAACGGDGGGAKGDAATSVPGPAYDATRPYWLQGNFAPVGAEEHLTDLEVRGTIPAALQGLYVRNGSNPVTGDSPHWFLGDGMVHGVRLEDGRARWYRNRWIDTPYRRDERGFGEGAPGGTDSQANVSVFRHGGRLLASGEVGYPFEVSTRDLSTVGAFDYDGGLVSAMTAHPKIDPATDRLHFFEYGFTAPYLTYHVAGPDGSLERSEEIPVAGPTMIHDFAITDAHAVFWEMPVVFDFDLAVEMIQNPGAGLFPFRWDPDYGARIGVLPFGAPGSEISWTEIEPCYVFHGANAFSDGDSVTLDVCRLDAAFRDGGDINESSAIHRWRIDAHGSGGAFADEVLSDRRMDLPAIDRRYAGRSQRDVWYVDVDTEGPFPFEFAGITHVDHRSGATRTWDPAPDERAGEVVFVPDSDDAGEGEGWLTTFTYEAGRDASSFVVLDAQDVAAGPVARVELPVRVPYGFHGAWVPSDA